jgi:hypothetical protein
LAVRPVLFGWISAVFLTCVHRATRLYHPFSTEMACIRTQDIDIVVSKEKTDAEEIKEAIAETDNRYYLERSRKRGATHQILYCRLPGWKTDPGRRVKVDILVPPTLGLPEIPDSDSDLEAIVFGWIPVMPIFDLLVMKTQGWWDHRTSPRSDCRAKERADVSDIFALLERAREEKVSYDDEGVRYDGALIGPPVYPRSEEFMVRALVLVKRFVRVYGSHEQWRALKFRV